MAIKGIINLNENLAFPIIDIEISSLSKDLPPQMIINF